MALLYNRTKAEQTLLKANDASPPSLSVDLFTEYWRLNSGPNCLYHTPIATLLEDIRARRVPVDFIQIFHTLRIPFYDGSLIVEIHDHRDQPVGVPMSERVVLWPNDETLYAEICLAASKDSGKCNDLDALTFEANHLLQREPDLILDPDPLVSKVVNASLAVSTPLPVSFKRKRDAIDTAQEEEEKVQRARTMNLMNPRANKSFVPDFRVIDRILHRRQELNKAQAQSRESASAGAPQSMMARKADSPAPSVMLNGGPSSRRRSNATQPPPVAVVSITNNLRRRNGGIPPSGKAVDESSPKESPTPQRPVPPLPTTQPPVVPAVAPRTMTPVQKPPPAVLDKPPESNPALQQPIRSSSPAVPATQPLQSRPEVHLARPPSQQPTGAGLNRPQLPQQHPSGPPAQYQPSPAHMLRQQQQQAQSAVMTAGASNPRPTATPNPNVQQAIARHPNNATLMPHQHSSQPPRPNPPAGPPANQQHTNFQGLNGAARYPAHGPPNVSGQQLPNGMQMPPNILQALQQQRRLQAMQQQRRLQAMNNNPQNYPHQPHQNGQQASNAAPSANITAMWAAAAQQPQQLTGQMQRPTPMGGSANATHPVPMGPGAAAAAMVALARNGHHQQQS